MSHSEDQQPGHKKGKSISRFYLFLSYLVILLVPAYIIYQGVFHSGFEKGSDKVEPAATTLSLMSDTNQLDAAYSRQPQFAQVAVAGPGENKASITRDFTNTASAETKNTQTIDIDIESANTDSIKTPVIDSDPAPREITSATETVAVEYVPVEDRALAPDNDEAENASAVNNAAGSAVNNAVTDSVLSSRSFAEINDVITHPAEQKHLEVQINAEQQPAYLTDIQAAEPAAENTETLSIDDKAPVDQASAAAFNAAVDTAAVAESEATVAASETKHTSELKEASEATPVSNQAMDSNNETDSVLSSRSFAEIDQGLNVPEEKKINAQQLVYPNNYNAAQDNKTRPQPIEFGIPDNTDVEFIVSDNIGQDAAISLDSIKDSDCVSISSKSFIEADAATSSVEKQEILKRQGNYITNINADGSITKCYEREDSRADTADSAAEDTSQAKTAEQTDNKELRYVDAGAVQKYTNNQPPPVPGPASFNQWRLPYRPYIKQYSNPALTARPDNSRAFQPMPYNRPKGSYQAKPYNKPDATYPMTPYNKSGRNYQAMPDTIPGSYQTMPFNKPGGSYQTMPYNTPRGAYQHQMMPRNKPGGSYQSMPYNKSGGEYQARPFNRSQTTYAVKPSRGENYRFQNYPATRPPAVIRDYYSGNKPSAPANNYRPAYNNTAPETYPPQDYYR